MPYNETTKKATIKYLKEKAKQIVIRYTKAEYEEKVRPAAEASGLKLATFIKKAIEEKIEKDRDNGHVVKGTVIAINEMEELPDNCHECPLSYCDDENCDYWCPWHHCTVDAHGGETRRMDGCPLMEIQA